MADTTINIVLFGLSMLVPNTQQPVTGMTAVMPDSTALQVSSDGCRIPFHQPVVLVKGAGFVTSDLAEKNALRRDLLSRDGYHGGWHLRGLEVRLKVYARDQSKPSECAYVNGPIDTRLEMDLGDTDDEGAWPKDEVSASKVGWLWKGSSTLQKQGVAVECLIGTSESCPVAARLIVKSGMVKVCRLAAIQVGDHNVPIQDREYRQGFQSRAQGGGTNFLFRSWPLPTAVRLSIDPGTASVLVLTERKLGESGDKEFLRFCPTPGLDQVWIGNTPLGNHSFQSSYCSQHNVDRHFELFYLLAEPDNQAMKPVLAVEREVPTATDGRMAKLQSVLQPKNYCVVPALFLDGTGHVPELTAVCGKGQGKPNWAAGRD